jgi:hypothetical protein
VLELERYLSNRDVSDSALASRISRILTDNYLSQSMLGASWSQSESLEERMGGRIKSSRELGWRDYSERMFDRDEKEGTILDMTRYKAFEEAAKSSV